MALEANADSYDKLLDIFKTVYTQNLLNSYKKTKSKNINIKNINEKRLNYKKYISLIKEIYALKAISDDDLFSKLYSQILDYKAKSQTQQDTKIDNDLFYIYMHGGFGHFHGFTQIPPNIVVVFLTPINRYGYQRTNDISKEIDKTFNNKDLKNKILNNIFCIDKINKKPKNNNRYHLNRFAFFENALVLLPGQYYYDLDLSFTEEDKGRNMGISYYGKKNIGKIIPKSRNTYLNTLSNIIHSIKPHTDQLSYVIIDCCRNLDYENKNGTDIYIYENFMLYFSTIMSNCNDEDMKSTFLPLKKFSKVYTVQTPEHFRKWDIEIANSFYTYINNNINAITEFVINYINSTDLKSNLQQILIKTKRKLKHYTEIDLIKAELNNIALMYDEKGQNEDMLIKIDVQIIYDFIFNLYNFNQLNNDIYDSAIIKLKELIIIIYNLTYKPALIDTVTGTDKTANLLVNLKDGINFLLGLKFIDNLTHIHIKQPLSLLHTILNEDISANENEAKNENISQLILPHLIIYRNKATLQKLINFIIIQKYNILIDTLEKLFNSYLLKMFVSEEVKSSYTGNSALGHIGRSKLTQKLYLHSQDLMQNKINIISIKLDELDTLIKTVESQQSNRPIQLQSNKDQLIKLTEGLKNYIDTHFALLIKKFFYINSDILKNLQNLDLAPQEHIIDMISKLHEQNSNLAKQIDVLIKKADVIRKQIDELRGKTDELSVKSDELKKQTDELRAKEYQFRLHSEEPKEKEQEDEFIKQENEYTDQEDKLIKQGDELRDQEAKLRDQEDELRDQENELRDQEDELKKQLDILQILNKFKNHLDLLPQEHIINMIRKLRKQLNILGVHNNTNEIKKQLNILQILQTPDARYKTKNFTQKIKNKVAKYLHS